MISDEKSLYNPLGEHFDSLAKAYGQTGITVMQTFEYVFGRKHYSAVNAFSVHDRTWMAGGPTLRRISVLLATVHAGLYFTSK